MYIINGKEKINFLDCNTFLSRLIGFMFKFDKITIGKRFPKCNSIHTFLCFQKLDIIMTDKNNKILKIYKNFKTERIILPKKNVYYVYEFGTDTINNFKVGDILKIKEKD